MAVEGDNPTTGTAQPNDAPKSAAEIFEQLEADPSQADIEDEQEPAAEPHGDPEAEDEPEAEEAEGEDSEAPDEQEDAETEGDGPQTVEIDGKAIPINEVKDGYLRQQDYTRKTQALAEERRELGAAVERVASVDREARQALELAVTVVKGVLPPAPDPSLIHTDPASYVQQKEAREQAVAVLKHLQEQQTSSEKRQSALTADETRKTREEQMKALTEKVPAFAKDDYRKQFRDEAITLGAKHYGLSADEVDSIASAKELLILRDALEYRKLQSKTMSAVAKAKNAPKIVAKPGTRENPKPAKGLSSLKNLGRAPTAREIFAALED